jgi:hypothetical protein
MMIVENTARWRKHKDYAHLDPSERDGAINKFLRRSGYEEANDAPGLVSWENSGFQRPWLPKNLHSVLRQVYPQGLTEETAAIRKATLFLNGVVKRLVMFTPYFFYMQILSTPLIYDLRNVNALLPLVPFMDLPKSVKQLFNRKDRGQGLLNIGNAALWGTLGAAASAALGFGGLPGLLIGGLPILRQGMNVGANILMNKENQFAAFEGMDSDKLGLFISKGMPANSFNWFMAAFFDKAELLHPSMRHESKFRGALGNIWEVGSGKLGMDQYTFNYLIPRMVYQFTDQMYERFKKAGHKDDMAAEMAVKLTSDLSGLLDNTIYGAEGSFLQYALFARNFTMSYARQVTGATWPIWRWVVRRAYRNKLGGMTNSLLHGEATDDVMRNLWGYYMRHLMVFVPMAKLMFANAVQYALWQLAGSDDDEPKFAWENPMGFKHVTRIPQKILDRYGIKNFKDEPIYLEGLMWREFNQFMDMLGSQAYWYYGGKGRGPWQLLRSKASTVFGTIVAIASNKDPASKADITVEKPEIHPGEKAKDYLSMLWRTATPSFMQDEFGVRQTDPALKVTLPGSGFRLKRGEKPPLGKTPEQYQRDKVFKAREELHRLRTSTYNKTEEELLQMQRDYDITQDRYFSELEKRIFGDQTDTLDLEFRQKERERIKKKKKQNLNDIKAKVKKMNRHNR